MKKRNYLIILCALLSCTSCCNKKQQKTNTYSHVHTYSETWTTDEFSHWKVPTCSHTLLIAEEGAHEFSDWVVDKEASFIENGNKHKSCSICNYTIRESIPMKDSITSSFTVYSFNDFHGAVNEYASQKHVGLAKFGTYLKNVSENENTLILESGDTFQGSIESNYNSGAMITDVFNYCHVDIHTLGNHDFDWGESKIESNKARAYSDGWHMTNLGGNIYDYDFSSHTEGNIQQSRLGEKYYIKTLENGIKVGVIGVIGLDQITSICSPLVADICFKNHISYIKSLSDELRMEKGCQIVIASVHNAASDISTDSNGVSTQNGVLEKGLTEISSVSGKKYVDYVVCGHSHKDECYQENGVYFTQAAAYGQLIYKASFNVSGGEVTSCDVSKLDYSAVTSKVSTVDPNITSIISEYAKDYSSVGEEVIASSTSGSFLKNNQMPNILAKAMYTTARQQGYMVDMACTNVARYTVSGSLWTYAKIYEAFPFDNVIYIVRIKGSKNVKEACYASNYCYHDSSLTTMNTTTWYTIAVIDYLLWHTNSSRIYDYFSHNSSYMEVLGTIKNSKGENFLYRDILASYVKGLSGTIVSSNFDNSNSEFTKPTVS